MLFPCFRIQSPHIALIDFNLNILYIPSSNKYIFILYYRYSTKLDKIATCSSQTNALYHRQLAEIFPGIDNGKLITPDRVRERYVTYTTKLIKLKINVKCKSIIQFIILEQLKISN